MSHCNCGFEIGDPRVHTHSEKCAGVYIRKLEARTMLLEAAIRRHRNYIVENEIGDCPEDENLWALLQEQGE